MDVGDVQIEATNLEDVDVEEVGDVEDVDVGDVDVGDVDVEDVDVELELTEEDIKNINSLELNQENLEILNGNNKENDIEFKNKKIVENLEKSIQDITNEQTNNLDSFLSDNERNIETEHIEELEDGNGDIEDELNDLSLEDLDSKSVNLEVLDNIKVDNDPDNLESIDRKKIKSKKYLNTLTVKQLKGLCKEVGVKSRGNKDELIKTLMK